MLIKTICVVGLTKDEILAQCLFFFLAGFETTGTTLGFALYYLAMNPEVQEKAQTEVDQVLGKKVRLNINFCLGLRSQHALRIDNSPFWCGRTILRTGISILQAYIDSIYYLEADY